MIVKPIHSLLRSESKINELNKCNWDAYQIKIIKNLFFYLNEEGSASMVIGIQGVLGLKIS